MPRAVFLAALIFLGGLVSLVLTPPFQVPDSASHQLRAFQISEGRLVGVRQADDSGGILPSALVEDSYRYNDLPFRGKNHITYQTWRERLKASGLLDPSTLSKRRFVGFANTVLYSPVPYFPQAIAFALARLLGLSGIAALYLAGFLNLISSVALVGAALWAVSFSPRAELSLFLIAGMPMSLFLLGSVSADSVTLSLAFLSVALALRLRRRFESRLFAVYVATGALLSLCKSLYFPITLFLLPSLWRAPEPRALRLRRVVWLLAASLGPTLLWGLCVRGIYTVYRKDVPVDPSAQLGFFLHHPFELTGVFIRGVWAQLGFYWHTFIGTFGWLDAPLPTGTVVAYTIGLLLVPLFGWGEEGAEVDRLAPFERLWGIVLFFGFLFALCLSMYLTWVPVGAKALDGIQGRYFIPWAPLLVLLIPRFATLKGRKLQVGRAVVFTGWFCALSSFAVTLFTRYWVR